jgi:aminopeptidase N
MHVPVRIGLMGQSGTPLPLTLEGENETGPESRVLELCAPRQSFVFVDVAEAPLLSLGRGFSAPAIFKAPHKRKDRAVLMGCDSDDFNRWESGQILAAEIILDGPQASDGDYITAIGAVLTKAADDPAFAAQMLMPPTESEIAALRSPADPQAIHAARVALMRAVARAHGARLAELYEHMRGPGDGENGDFSPDAKSAGRRALRNACLRCLTAADDEAAAGLADAHYRTADNMTDMIAGLAALTRMESLLRDEAFTDFHDRFRNDPLVLDKWMSLQAGAPLPETIAAVRALMKHPAFDLKNPNRVRALIGAFSANHLCFHDASGDGYQLVGDVIRALDPMNPLVAARLAGAFETWRRYGTHRQVLMRAELEKILARKNLSPNLFEVANKILG